MQKRLIEDSLPLKEISKQSAREKSIRHGLYFWWARRPLAACRAHRRQSVMISSTFQLTNAGNWKYNIRGGI